MDAPEIEGVRQVSPAQAAGMAADGALLVDVREEHEWEAARIPGSVWHPLSRLQSTWGQLPAGQAIVLVCAAGARSHMAARFLRSQGLSTANLAGGLHAWHAAGLPVEH